MGDVSQLEVFFRPKSVAVVGASSDPKKPGYTALIKGYAGVPVRVKRRSVALQPVRAPLPGP